MKRTLPGLEPTVFAFGSLAPKLCKFREKLVETFFPSTENRFGATKKGMARPRFFGNYENLETDLARAGALIYCVGRPTFRSP